jgi:hypothetical protein
MRAGLCWIFLVSLVPLAGAQAAEPASPASQDFAADPDWDGFRNRLLPESLPMVRQDFGYSPTRHAGGSDPGELGGRVQRSVRRASYGKAIPVRTLKDPLHATGRLAVTHAEGGSGAMIGWFHETSRGWRTPNSVAMRIDGNGGKYWLFYEYGTRHGMTGGGGAYEGDRYQTTPTPPFRTGPRVHDWELQYTPGDDDEDGRLDFRIDDRRYTIKVAREHKEDSAQLNRFGIWNVQIAGSELHCYLDDLVVDGQRISLDKDPQWQADGNRVEYQQRVKRPYHDFGYSATNHAGGTTGEIGGILFRDERPAYYAAPTGKLSLEDELKASGKLVFLDASADSGCYLGWFDSQTKQNNDTPEHEARQKNYLAIMIEGPSRVGHYVRPSYGTSQGKGLTTMEDDAGKAWSVLRPDKQVHDWSIHYRPQAAKGRGTITVTLDEKSQTLTLRPDDKKLGTRFDRFGFFNMQAGGHHVRLYADDVTFTNAGDQEKAAKEK